MFRPKTLIQLLVCLALILNGVGAAAASTAMAVKPVGGAMQSGCHEQPASTAHPDADAMDPDTATGDMNPSDCCKDGGCGCGCAHQSQVVLAAEFLVMPAISPASIPWADLAALLSPSLSRPVRPPIA